MQRPTPAPATLLLALAPVLSGLLSPPPAAAQDAATLAAYEACRESFTSAASEPTETIRLCQRPAEAGLPGAQYALGELLLEPGPTYKPEAAYHWFRLAAGAGHPAAQLALALLTLNGQPTGLDRDGALADLQRAYCAGFPEAVDLVGKQGIDPAKVACEAGPAPFEGTWSGVLPFVHSSPADTPLTRRDLTVRLTLRGKTAKVETREEGGPWTEVQPGGFHFEPREGSAVVWAQDDGWDLDGHWVEGWTLTLVARDPNTLEVTWARTVEDLQTPDRFASGTVSAVAAGRLTRDQPPAQAP